MQQCARGRGSSGVYLYQGQRRRKIGIEQRIQDQIQLARYFLTHVRPTTTCYFNSSLILPSFYSLTFHLVAAESILCQIVSRDDL